jgi:hypothetical protein
VETLLVSTVEAIVFPVGEGEHLSVLGNYLRTKRVAAKLGLREAADLVGCSHTFLGEIERGVRTGLPERWLEPIAAAIPTVELKELRNKAMREGTLQLKLADAPPQYQDLGLALARRIEKKDLPSDTFDEIMRLLRRDDE